MACTWRSIIRHGICLIWIEDLTCEAGNELEAAKTSLKFSTMVLQKNTEGEAEGLRVDRRELNDAVDILSEAIPSFRGRAMLKELEEGERLLYALQRTLIRTR